MCNGCCPIQPGSTSKEVSYLNIWRQHTPLKGKLIGTFNVDIIEVEVALVDMFTSW